MFNSRYSLSKLAIASISNLFIKNCMEPICKTDRLKPITAIDSILFYRYLDSGNCYTFAVENINYLKVVEIWDFILQYFSVLLQF